MISCKRDCVPQFGSPMNGISLSLAIPTHNRAEVLVGLLDTLSLARNRTASPPDVWILVNGEFSGYESVVEKTSDWPWLKWLWDPTAGLARARNQALRKLKTTHIAFLDDDARVGPNWIIEAKRAIQRFPEAAALGGPYTADFDARAKPRWLPDGFGSAHVGHPEGPVRFVNGGNMIVAREAALSAGGFPEHLGMRGTRRLWGEETALFLEFERRGLPIVLVPAMTVRHLVNDNLLTLCGHLTESFKRGWSHGVIFPLGGQNFIVNGAMSAGVALVFVSLGLGHFVIFGHVEHLTRGLYKLGQAASAFRKAP